MEKLRQCHASGLLIVMTVVSFAIPASAQNPKIEREGAYVRLGLGVGVGQEFGVPGLYPLLVGGAGTLAVGTFVTPNFALEFSIDPLAGVDVFRPSEEVHVQGGVNGVVRLFLEETQEGLYVAGGVGVGLARHAGDDGFNRAGIGAIGGAGWEDKWHRNGSWGVFVSYGPRILFSGGFGLAHAVQGVAYLVFPFEALSR